MLEVGITHSEALMVTDENTALALGSGTVRVFATPAMINMIEFTSSKAVAGELDTGQTTVGTELHVSHVAPTPIGMEVRCTSKLVKVDGRALSFEVEVVDDTGVVGRGTHDRFIVDQAKFESKANAKLG